MELCTDSVEKPVYKAVQSVYSCKVGRRCLFFRQWRPGSGQRDNLTGWREILCKRFGFSAAGAHPARGRPPRQSFHRGRRQGDGFSGAPAFFHSGTDRGIKRPVSHGKTAGFAV